jgi:hypothetical protein
MKAYTAKSYSPKTLSFAEPIEGESQPPMTEEEITNIAEFQNIIQEAENFDAMENYDTKTPSDQDNVQSKSIEKITSPEIPSEDRSADYYSPFSLDFEEKITPDMQKAISSQFKDLISKDEILNPKEQKGKN